MTTHELTARARAHQSVDTFVRAGAWIVLGAIALLAVIAAVGCKTGSGISKGYIRVEAIEGSIQSVVARHDAYVTADATLAPEQREIYLTTSELLLRVVDEAASK